MEASAKTGLQWRPEAGEWRWNGEERGHPIGGWEGPAQGGRKAHARPETGSRSWPV